MAERSAVSQDDRQKSAIGLFSYLRELAKLRGRVKRLVESYESILWFSDIPREAECYTPAWGDVKESHEDIWLGVKKPRFSAPPAVPPDVRPWFDEDQVRDFSSELELKERIPVPQPEGEPEYIELTDNISIWELGKKYLDEKWRPWAEEQRRLRKIQDVYAKLHTMYQYQKTQEETHELILGLGLLTWRTPSGQSVKRPLIVAQATVELDTKRGTLFVKQGADGAKPVLEDEMLELGERCPPDVRSHIEGELLDIGDEIWEGDNIELVLKEWVNSVTADGVYSRDITPPQDFSLAPHVNYAPILIIRRRDVRGWVTSFDAVIKELENGETLPFGVKRVIEIVDDYADDGDARDDDPKEYDAGDILFPKLANAEQERIVEYLVKRQGVVVQGPPGTGKSHTIANLVSHLLATGQRVLVTSETPRALNVLRRMIPEEIAALCVCLLGRDRDSLESLKKSVGGISERKIQWEDNPGANDRDIEKLSKKLDSSRRREAEITRRLIEGRERETYEHRVCDGTYVGTAQQIAIRVSSESEKYAWLDLNIPADLAPVLTNEEALELLDLNRTLTPALMNEGAKEIVNLSSASSPASFNAMKEYERTARERYDSFADARQTDIYANLRAASNEVRLDLRLAVLEFLGKRQTLLHHKDQWAPKAMEDVLSRNDKKWRYLCTRSTEILGEVEGIVRKADER